jgi:O-antigen/teichoic acid export membrane protein
MDFSGQLAEVRWSKLRQQGTDLARRALASDFLRKVVETFGTRVLLVAMSLATSVIVTRTLGPEGRGLYATTVAVGVIGAQFANLGLHASNTYYVARDRGLLPALLGNSLLVSFGLGGFGVLIAWVVFVAWPQIAPLDGVLLGLALWWIPFALAYMLLQNLLLGIQEIRAYNTIELVTKLISIGLIVLLIALGAVTPAMMYLASFATMVIGLLWVTWRLRARLARQVAISADLFRQGLRYGFKAYLAAFFAYMVLRVDLLMVKQMLGAEAAGYYSVAANLADLALMLPVVTGSLLFPRLSAMSSGEQRWRFASKVAAGVGGVMLVGVVAARFLAQFGITLLYGDLFLPAVPPFLWLLPAIVLMSVNTILMNYFAASGMPPVTVYSPGVAALLNMALNLWLLPRLGIVGASLSSIAAYGLMLSFSVGYLYAARRERGQ